MVESNVFVGGYPADVSFRQTVSFDDVLLIPKHSDILSRNEVCLDCKLGDMEFTLPVISSPMDTVTEEDMSEAMIKAGGVGVLHRYNSIDEQIQMVSKLVDRITTSRPPPIACAIGATGDYLERACAVVEHGAKILCIDVAHGHHSIMKHAIQSLRESFNDGVHIMAGNVATLEGFNALASWGAHSIRVGIGGGSICSTRIVTGHGVPTLHSIFDCSRSTFDAKIIADGGIRTTGDMVKAFAAGADFVMIGSMLAGTDEAPGEIFARTDGKKYKVYRGMASRAAQKDWRDKSATPEGISTTIPYKGDVASVLQDIRGGICSGLSYTGVRNLVGLRTNCQFIKQSASAQQESYTHILLGKG
jgi:IMP dehydrogenase